MTSEDEVHVALEEGGSPVKPPPRGRHRPPHITLPVIQIQGPHSANLIDDSGPNHIGATSVTPGSPYVMPIPAHMIYHNKAGEFMFKQFQGFKGVAKSGLSVGEKSAFWFYNKVRELSRKWFTHAFLFLVVLGYTCLGAVTFVTFEGAHELEVKRDVWDNRISFAKQLQELASDEFLREDAEQMEMRTLQAIRNYELSFYDSIMQGYFPKENTNPNIDNLEKKNNKVWTFWNAVFYCGTIYTTIGRAICALGACDTLSIGTGRRRALLAQCSFLLKDLQESCTL